MKALEKKQELALGDEVSLAGLVDQLGDFAHGAMNGQVFQSAVDDQAEEQAKDAEQNAEEEQLMAVDAEKLHLRQVGKFEIWPRRRLLGRFGRKTGGGEQR